MSDTGLCNGAYFWAILYPENMIPDWEVEISKLLQLPFCYIIHDKDLRKEKEEERKKHIHLIIAFHNTTTINHAFNVINKLSASGKQAIPNNRIEVCIDIAWCYKYLIHDTEDCRKKRKHLYNKTERIEGNGFDIGLFEQVSLRQKHEMLEEIDDLVLREGISNYADLKIRIKECFEFPYWEVFHSYSSHFHRLTNGVYQKLMKYHNS